MGNSVRLDDSDLVEAGISFAVGIGEFESENEREVAEFGMRALQAVTQVDTRLDSPEEACELSARFALQ